MKSKNISSYFQNKIATELTRSKFKVSMSFINNFQYVSDIFKSAPSSVVTRGILDSKFCWVCSISFWSSVCFIFLGTALSMVLPSKLKTQFHWIKSIYKCVYNISGFTFTPRICPSLLRINSVILPSSHFCRYCLSSNTSTKSFCLALLPFLVYVVFDIFLMTSHILLGIFTKNVQLCFRHV